MNPSQSIRNDDYLLYVPVFDPLSTNNITIPDTVSPITHNCIPTDDLPYLSVVDDQRVHNETNDFELDEAHETDILEVQDIILNNVNTTNDAEPSPIIISPSAKINHETPASQEKWSTDNHILEHETIVDENVEDPLATDSGIRLLGNVDLDQIMKVMEEADSDVESMPDDEILSISGDDDKEDDFDRELPLADEVVADHVIDEILNEVNKEDTHTIISVVTPKEVSFVFVPQSASVSSLWDALGAMKRFKEIQITKAPGSDPFVHLPQRLDFLAAQVYNLAKFLPNQFTENINSAASIVPRLVFNALAQELLDLLIATIKNTLPRSLTKAVREIFPRFNKRIRNTIKDEMPDVLNTSVIKPMYK
ncbi:hypothetical protein Tco_0078166 [Tanacetum coccineum]